MMEKSIKHLEWELERFIREKESLKEQLEACESDIEDFKKAIETLKKEEDSFTF